MNRDRISIQGLIDLIAKHLNVDRKIIEDFLLAFFATIEEALLSGETVKIKNFGTFKIQWNEPRKSVNVQSGNEIIIEGFNKITFIPEASLRELINEPYSFFENIIIPSDDENNTFDINRNDDLPSNSAEIDENENNQPFQLFNEQAEEIKNILFDLKALSNKNEIDEEEYENYNEENNDDEVDIVEGNLVSSDNIDDVATDSDLSEIESDVDKDIEIVDNSNDNHENVDDFEKTDQVIESEVDNLEITKELDSEPVNSDLSEIESDVDEDIEIDENSNDVPENDDDLEETDQVVETAKELLGKNNEEIVENSNFESTENEIDNTNLIEVTEESIIRTIDKDLEVIYVDLFAEPVDLNELDPILQPINFEDNSKHKYKKNKKDVVLEEVEIPINKPRKRTNPFLVLFVFFTLLSISFILYNYVPTVTLYIDKFLGLDQVKVTNWGGNNSTQGFSFNDYKLKDSIVINKIIESTSDSNLITSQLNDSLLIPFDSISRKYDEFITIDRVRSSTKLSTLAEKFYGHKEFWIYIYEANLSTIRNPRNIGVGTIVRIPKVDSLLIDEYNPLCIQFARKVQKKYKLIE